jgi:hypothetical protein
MFFLDDLASDTTKHYWHSKEEILNLISSLVLETKRNEEWFYGIP